MHDQRLPCSFRVLSEGRDQTIEFNGRPSCGCKPTVRLANEAIAEIARPKAASASYNSACWKSTDSVCSFAKFDLLSNVAPATSVPSQTRANQSLSKLLDNL